MLTIAVNLEEQESPSAKEAPEAEEHVPLEMSGYNPQNPKGHYQQVEFSEYGNLGQFVTAVHEEWYDIHPEQRYIFKVDGKNTALLSNFVREINYWEAAIEEAMLVHEFDKIQSTAFQISSPQSELLDEQKSNEVFSFEDQLDNIYKRVSPQ